MNYNTTSFIFFFFPICLILFHVAPVRYRLYVLLIFSLIFYGVSGLLPLGLLISAMVWGFGAAFIIYQYRKLYILFVAISLPLGQLFIAKYFGFTLDTINISPKGSPALQYLYTLALPAGISFYTFQIVSYLIDVYDKKETNEKNAVQLLTYISFFPQLIAGPILRYEQVRNQLKKISNIKNLDIDWMTGIKYCVFGLFYKTFFADILATMQSSFTTSNTSSIDALFSIISYSVVIYFDFWGYSLMAMGLATFFAIKLPRNFNEPYLACSPKDFWRRWHITLSYWLRDYVYIKCKGNEHYIRNILIIFIICGLWHGAGWNFIVWGGYHALLVIAYHLSKNQWNKLPAFVQIIVTFMLITIGWPLFYLGLNEYLDLYQTLFSFSSKDGGIYGTFNWVYLSIVLAWIFFVREEKVLFNVNKKVSDNPLVLAFGLSLSIVFLSFGKTFIYFQF